MLELAFAPPERAKVFQCSTCPKQTQDARRCRESREDYTYKDNGSVFPIMVTKSGEQFSFCPAKATWDSGVTQVFQILLISFETGNLWHDGGIADQPAWFIELLGLFLVRYGDHKFYSRAQAILGDSSTKAVKATKGSK